MIKPVFTEKSLRLAKEGRYTFLVGSGLTKNQIKSQISKIFGVHVVGIKTIATAPESGKNVRGMKFATRKGKKAIITLKEKEKIDVFEEAKK